MRDGPIDCKLQSVVVFQEHGRRRAGVAARLSPVAVRGAADVVRLPLRHAVLPGGDGAVEGRRHRAQGL